MCDRVAGRQEQCVVADHVGSGDDLLPAVPDDTGLRLGEDGDRGVTRVRVGPRLHDAEALDPSGTRRPEVDVGDVQHPDPGRVGVDVELDLADALRLELHVERRVRELPRLDERPRLDGGSDVIAVVGPERLQLVQAQALVAVPSAAAEERDSRAAVLIARTAARDNIDSP